MRDLREIFESMAGLFTVIVFAVYVLVGLGVAVCTVYGFVLAFSVSILLGLVCLFVSPLATVIGVYKIVTGVNLAIKIVEFINK